MRISKERHCFTGRVSRDGARVFLRRWYRKTGYTAVRPASRPGLPLSSTPASVARYGPCRFSSLSCSQRFLQADFRISCSSVSFRCQEEEITEALSAVLPGERSPQWEGRLPGRALYKKSPRAHLHVRLPPGDSGALQQSTARRFL